MAKKQTPKVKLFLERVNLISKTLQQLDVLIEERHNLTDFYLKNCLGDLTEKDKEIAHAELRKCTAMVRNWTQFDGDEEIELDDPIRTAKIRLLGTSIFRCGGSLRGILEVDWDDPSEAFFED